jgi:NAD(P)H-dependent flavin oxidoreductase YrpB (nitropropane dioxygenase family)
VSGENYRQSFQETGDPETSVWSAGQVMGLIDDIPTCAVLIARMVADAEAIIAGRLPRMLVPPSRL